MSKHKGKPIIGLIGTIGAGKSAAAAAFVRRGGGLVDADRIGHEVLEAPDIREKILARWRHRDDLLQADERINRRVVASIVFASDPEREALESLVFPEIERRCHERIAELQRLESVKFIVLDAAVLLEAGWKESVDQLVYIDAPQEVRMSRVVSRGWTDRELAARESAQWPAERKRQLADAVIVNAGTLDDLQRAIDEFLTQRGWL